MAVSFPPDDAVAPPPETTFYLAKDNETFGPHSVGDIESFLRDGVVSAGDLLWTDGMAEWAPIGELFSRPPDASAEEAAPVSIPPAAGEDAAPIWARGIGDGMSKRLGIGLATAVVLHVLLIVILSLSAAVLFRMDSEPATASRPQPAPLEVTMVEEPDEPPPAPPPPPPDDPPPPPAIPDVPIPTDMPPPAPPQLVTAPQPVITPPTTMLTRVAPLAPPAPHPMRVARRAPPVEAPSPGPVDAGPSDYLNAPPPVYPYAARQDHEAGTVVLLVAINEEGLPVSVTVETSSGFPILDSVAQKQVEKEFRFRVGNSRQLRVPISFQEK